MSTPELRCKCATLPQIVLGKTTKLPVKAFDVLKSKPHPGNPMYIPGSPTWVTLVRCKACGELWQADAWSRSRVGYTSWPEVCIKVATVEGWEEFVDRPLREAFFPEMGNGLSGERCGNEKCNDMAVKGLLTCANCTCKARYAKRAGA
jgi:hypothetical protein